MDSYNHYNQCSDYNDYRDSDLDFDLDWERVIQWLSDTAEIETWIMTLRSSDLQSDSDLDSIRNIWDVLFRGV